MLTVPSRSGADANGSAAAIWVMVRAAAPSGSPKRLKMGDRFALVARVSLRRSSLGPGWVRSCGRMRPGPYSSTRTRASTPVRVRLAPAGSV